VGFVIFKGKNMATVKRVNGDSAAVVATDIDLNTDNQARAVTGIIAPGLTGRQVAFKINGFTGYCASSMALESGTNITSGNVGLVSRVLDVIQSRSIVTMYQVESTSAQISVLVENDAWTDATLQANIRALGSALGVYGNSSAAAATVSSTSGFKLA